VVLELSKGVIDQYLLNSAGLWFLLALIPLTLAYLIRPRPKKQTIPALMFLMRDNKNADKRSFFRKFIRDPLFLFQMLLLIAFAIAIARPFLTMTEDVFVEKTVLLVDASASSQVVVDGKSRFERTIELAKDKVGSKNTVIVMSSVPELLEDNIEGSKAKDELSNIKPRDTSTAIFDSIIFAGNYVKEKDKVVVISDFIETGTQKDFYAAKSILESQGIIVEFVNLRQFEAARPKNIGIIDLDIKEDKTSINIKNFNDINETVSLDMPGTNLTMQQLNIGPKTTEVVTFPTPPALSKFSIVPLTGHDDFEVDNEVFISAPLTEAAPLLLIANTVSKHLATALEVIGTVTVERGTPPKVPDVNHQIIMINNINGALVLPGTFNSIKKKVEDGAALVIVAQPDLFSTDFGELLPVDRVDRGSPVLIEHEVYVTPTYETSITEDINFGRVRKYLRVKPVDGSTILATTTNNVSMIVLKSLGKGLLVYFGFMDDYSTFKEDIYYPVFWKRLFDLAVKKQDLSELNFRTGRLINLLKEEELATPFGRVKTETILLSHQGIYKGEEKSFVANLLNEEESNINDDNTLKKEGIFDDSKSREKIPFEFTHYIIIALLVLIFVELLWIKFRGDL
jgi:hypothetical protein